VLFLIVKYIHILSAIVAVGMNISSALWMLRARSQPDHLAFALKWVKFIDDRVANPAYGLLLITGLLMVVLLPYPITTFWIDVSLVLYAIVVVLAIAVFTPALRDQLRLAEAGEMSSASYARVERRGQLAGQLIGVVVLVILAMMVFKPTL
jgi:uncharacterized membrane protein